MPNPRPPSAAGPVAAMTPARAEPRGFEKRAEVLEKVRGKVLSDSSSLLLAQVVVALLHLLGLVGQSDTLEDTERRRWRAVCALRRGDSAVGSGENERRMRCWSSG